MAGGIHLVNCPQVRRAATSGRAIQVAFRIENYAGIWTASVGSAGEILQHGLLAVRVQFVHDACVSRSASASGSVKITGGVGGYASIGVDASRRTGEVMQDDFAGW